MKTLTFDYPQLGFNLICFDCYMYLGDLEGNLPIEKIDMPFGQHLFRAGVSRVVQIGDEKGHSLWAMLKLMEGSHLLYLGVLQGEKCPILLFEPFENNQTKYFRRDLFGNIADMPYKNLYVAFNYLNADELHITTRNYAFRAFRPTVAFVPGQQD